MSEKHLNVILRCAAIFFVVAAVIGGFRAWSPVPLAEGLDACLGFYQRVSKGEWLAFWLPQDGHRLVLSRLLFWLDLRLFNGRGIFPVVANYLLVVAGFLILRRMLAEALPAPEQRGARLSLVLMVACVLFSWVQHENLARGFRNPYFLAQLLPLAAFYCLHRASHGGAGALRCFGLACLAGVLACGSMVSGLVTLPLLTIMALLLRLGRGRAVLLALLSLACIGLYLHGYSLSPQAGAGLMPDAGDNRMPWLVVAVLLLFTGMACGAGMLWRQRPLPSLQLAALGFLVYLLACLAAVLAGPFHAGSTMSTVLMGCAALLVLYAVPLQAALQRFPSVRWLFLLLPLGLLPAQISALPADSRAFEFRMAALALQLNINDPLQISWLAPAGDAARVVTESREPLVQGLAVFGEHPYVDAAREMGVKSLTGADVTRRCAAAVDGYSRIAGDSRYVRISGWFYDAATGTIPDHVAVLDDDGVVVGYVLTGQQRRDAGLPDHLGRVSGFKGYLSASSLGKHLTMLSTHPECYADFVLQGAAAEPHGTPPCGSRFYGWDGRDLSGQDCRP